MNSPTNIPDREGIWEWFNHKGEKKLVEVFNCNPDKSTKPYLRVYFWGAYYNVREVPENSPFDRIEWSGPWGERVGDSGSIPVDKIYFMPTPEELEKIIKNYE